MTREELIKILEDYEIFVDDDFGGSYQSIIAYTPDKKVSRAHTPIGTLKIIDTFEKMQKEKQELKEQLERSKKARKEAIGFINDPWILSDYKIGNMLHDYKTKAINILDIDEGEIEDE